MAGAEGAGARDGVPRGERAAGAHLLQPRRALAVPRGRPPHRLRVWPPDLGVEAGASGLPPPADLCCSLQVPGVSPLGHPMVHGDGSTSSTISLRIIWRSLLV